MKLLDALRQYRLVAIVRGSDPAATLDAVLTLADCGIALIEVSLTTPDALGVLTRARRALGPDFGLGAGTVLTVEQAQATADAGVSYVVTPGLAPSVAEARALGLPALVGAVTPTEVIAAHAAGAEAVKLFPASIGGPEYLRALRDPLPDIPLVPVGGVDAHRAGEYLRAGAVAVGVGSPLLGDAPHGGDLLQLRARAALMLAAVTA
ncbi:aldolase [Longispora fulva]|uniref:2-dehydro-3-deoxyphosphogluconate aldolase/(4S)-4-hydroxy-2-oxoglutarate aldolase n=1 Tax=Longispora fulva TaxID=619741 RepID=A0A8J7KUA5_9ACTN|nr:bifunctional 4-hydroxy-2-oxoglutarate aldolase/2-dehydro-3-deoxy-phosphogluconate aldolase [Longispora fulva]MBG6133862.1 2-dehydro-3-deoxyphosphogluconate aldolase/(4S)-4-hydroxy-2-oxoglutarate aldolase [Longispora fulva]GIG62902.1 aldolase [Longispora fulva]